MTGQRASALNSATNVASCTSDILSIVQNLILWAIHKAATARCRSTQRVAKGSPKAGRRLDKVSSVESMRFRV